MLQKENQNDYYFIQVSVDLIQIGPDLVYGSNPLIFLKNIQNSSSSTCNGKHRDSIRINIFYNLLPIETNLFEDLILDDLVSYTSA